MSRYTGGKAAEKGGRQGLGAHAMTGMTTRDSYYLRRKVNREIVVEWYKNNDHGGKEAMDSDNW